MKFWRYALLGRRVAQIGGFTAMLAGVAFAMPAAAQDTTPAATYKEPPQLAQMQDRAEWRCVYAGRPCCTDRSLATRGGRYRRTAPFLTPDSHRAIQSEPRYNANAASYVAVTVTTKAASPHKLRFTAFA
jgi:hypothetical protein